MDTIVVVGGGIAGAYACSALRDQGYTGRLTLVAAEAHLPYDRPPLSKAVLAGSTDDITLPFSYDELRVDVRLRERATALRPGALRTDRSEIGWDGLVIATGAVPLLLPGAGPQVVVRTLDDARALRERLQPGTRVVVVGAGWIGAEVATAAATAGCAVTVLEAGDAPLSVALGAEVGAATAPWYATAGVDLLTGVRVGSVEPGGVALSDGRHLPADVVVTGIGVRPAVDWLHGSGLELDGGIAVDEHGRASWDDVVAIGDCAARWSPRFGTRLRLEHWDEAVQMPTVAATTLLGGDAVHDPVPYVWSDQFGHRLQYAGHHAGADSLLWRGDPAVDPSWAVAWLQGETLVGFLASDRPRDLLQARRLVGMPIDRAKLADPGVPVKAAA